MDEDKENAIDGGTGNLIIPDHIVPKKDKETGKYHS